MRLIDAVLYDDKLTELYKELAEELTNDEHYMFTADGIVDAQLLLDDMPTIDAVEVIRCKDCPAFYDTGRTDWGLCRLNGQVRHDDFCSWAERREE